MDFAHFDYHYQYGVCKHHAIVDMAYNLLMQESCQTRPLTWHIYCIVYSAWYVLMQVSCHVSIGIDNHSQLDSVLILILILNMYAGLVLIMILIIKNYHRFAITIIDIDNHSH